MSWLDGIGNFFGDLFGGGSSGGGGIDWSQTTPFDAITVDSISPADIFSNVAGLTNTPSFLDGVGSFFSGGGGDFLGNLLRGGSGAGTAAPTLAKLLGAAGGGGGGTAGGGDPTEVSPLVVPGKRPAPATSPDWATILTQVPGLWDTPGFLNAVGPLLGGAGGTPQVPKTPTSGTPQPGAGNPAAAGSGAPNAFPSLGGLAGLTGLIGPVMAALNGKSQTDLGPDAAAMRAIASGNGSLIQSLQGEAQAEKMGNLPGPAMMALQDSLAEQKAGFRGNYNQMGMSGSSAEAADLAALNRKSEESRFQIGLNMAGEALGQVSSLNSQDIGIYQGLMQEQGARDREYMDAMSRLAEGIGRAFSGPGSAASGSGSMLSSLFGGGGGSTQQDLLNQILGITSKPIDPSSLTGLTATNPLASVLGGVDPSSLISPATDVAGLVPTGTGLPDFSIPDFTGA